VTSRFAELLPAVERAHAATRLVIPRTGCQLGASLLALELGRGGEPAEYATGFYSPAPEQQHWWVEVDGLLLDPTRDQFHEDPFAERHEGHYERTGARPATAMVYEAMMQLRLHWSTNRRARDAIKEVALRYHLDVLRIAEPLGPLTAVGP